MAQKKAIRIKCAAKTKKCVLSLNSPRFSQPPSKHNMQYRRRDNTPYQLSGGISDCKQLCIREFSDSTPAGALPDPRSIVCVSKYGNQASLLRNTESLGSNADATTP